MPKPFDATTKELLESDPRAWLELLLGRKVGEVRILNVDLSTITTEADTVLLVQEIEPWVVHLEFQSSYDPDLPLRLRRYSILVHYRHRFPVVSIALLLCPDANGPAMTGLLQHRWPDGLVYHEFRYNVVRTWERPADEILAGGLATLPLAPLAKVKENELPAVIQAMRQRLDREATRGQAGMLWTATYVLMGLTYSDELIDRLLEGVQSMKESVTYQKILREGLAKGLVEGRAEGRVEGRVEGLVEGERRILRRQGTRRFGKPDTHIEAALDAIADLERLEQLSDRVLEVKTWDELLAQP
jgi:predicted transposase YdaD